MMQDTKWPEPVAFTAPLPCYSLEHDSADPRCQECPHQTGCIQHTGKRVNRVGLSHVKFKLVPESYSEAYKLDLEDPELPHLQRAYFKCYDTVFNRKAHDSVARYAEALMSGARKSKCSAEMFMLANMVGHRETQKIRIANTTQAFERPFRAKMLSGKQAILRARDYSAMCNKEFGVFNLTSLSVLVDKDFDESELYQVMLHSECVAGKFIVGHKIFHGGPPWEELFNINELTLDPHWLAIDPTYMREVFGPYLVDKKGDERLKQHRFSVSQVIGELKKKRTAAINTFRTREEVMPKAISNVLTYFGHAPDDFEIEPEPITDPLEFWIYVGRAMQHYQCILHLSGQRSMFNR